MANCYHVAPDRLIRPLLAHLREALGDDFVALYLYGSAVSGGFDASVSDLDLVAVTRRAVELVDLAALDDVHHQFVERDVAWTDRLEIVYAARDTLASPAGLDSVAVISPGEPFHLTGPARDWLQNWYLVRETGVALFGPPPRDIIAPISRSEFLSAVRSYLGYLRRVSSHGYAVLSACRAACTLETGAPCSKQEGAAWVAARMREWRWLIDVALADRLSHGRSAFDDPRTRAAARRFVNILAARQCH